MKWIKSNIKNLFCLNDHPEKIAKGFAMGSFIGMLPIPGFQVLVALGMASLTKVNKKATCIAVFNTNIATGAFVFAFNFWLGKQILGYNSSFSMPEKINIHFFSTILNAGTEVFLSLTLGGVISGTVTGAIAYFILKYVLINRADKGFKGEVKPKA